jgi:hypothetical protein
MEWKWWRELRAQKLSAIELARIDEAVAREVHKASLRELREAAIKNSTGNDQGPGREGSSS